MTITLSQIWLYAGAQMLLVLSPGPVVAALVARVISRGMKAALPIALAVFVGDMIWVSLAIFGASAIIAANAGFLAVIRFGGALYLLYLGIQEIRHAREAIIAADLQAARGFWQNFLAGFVIIMTNPKAVLFYVLFVPQFFDVSKLGTVDIAIVVFMSGLIPFIGNMIWASVAQLAAKQFKSENGRARLRIISGISLILVAIALAIVH